MTVKAWWLHATRKARGRASVGGGGDKDSRQAAQSMLGLRSQRYVLRSPVEHQQVLKGVAMRAEHSLRSLLWAMAGSFLGGGAKHMSWCRDVLMCELVFRGRRTLSQGGNGIVAGNCIPIWVGMASL
jgi:hypothetical protein